MRELSKRVVGVKQTRRAIQEGRAIRVYLAADADPMITDPLAALCEAAAIPVEGDKTLRSWAAPRALPWAPPPWRRSGKFSRFFRNSLRAFRKK